jgi:S-adenosylmethionine:tRNA ribosyltransferase-isomerase
MRRADFHFDLPAELIAQAPLAARSASRLLLLDAAQGLRRDLAVRDLPDLLDARDLLVFNDTRVIPARIHAQKESGGRIELLLERIEAPRIALVHARASKALKRGGRVLLPGGQTARLLGRAEDLFRLEFSCEVLDLFEAQGQMPLPPYIGRTPCGRGRRADGRAAFRCAAVRGAGGEGDRPPLRHAARRRRHLSAAAGR